MRVAELAIHIRDSLPGGTFPAGTSRPGRMAVNTLYLTAGALGSGFAFATPGIMGSMTAREANFIISRRFISKSRFQAQAALPQQIADHHGVRHDTTRYLLMMSVMIIFMISVLYKVKAFGAAHVKVSREQVAEHRIRILAAAARLFRQRGFDDVTVAEVMKDAGLTHGAFYGYFPSKEALIAEAIGQALTPAPDQAKPRRAAAEFADGYLSVRHRDNRPSSCLFSSLGTEAARGSADLRHRMTEAVRNRTNHLSVEAEGDRPKEKRRAAIAAWSAMVGAMVLARLVDDEALSKEILSATRVSLPLR